MATPPQRAAAPLPAPFPERPPVGAAEAGYGGRSDGYSANGHNNGYEDGYDYDGAAYVQDRGSRPPDRRSSPALLVSAGGLVAAVAVIAMAFLWPHTSTAVTPAGRIASDLPTAAPTTPEPTTEAKPPPRTRERPPPPRTTTAAPPTTTAPPKTTDPAPPTTTAPPPTSTAVPTTTAAADGDGSDRPDGPAR